MSGEPPDTLVVATGHALSLALLSGGRVLAASHQPMEAGHAEALLPALDALAEGERRLPVGRILVETGPGSFTGLRIGLAAARALGLAWRVPVLGVSSTALVLAEARAAGAAGPLLVALAAPRGQVWLEAEGEGLATACTRAEAAERARAWLAAGGAVTGSAAPALAGASARPEREPRAAAAAVLPEAVLGPPVPRYAGRAPARDAARAA